MTYLVERLVSSGHARRESDPRDRRRVVLKYAEHGHEVASAYFGPLGAHLATALAGHDDAALAAALDVIVAMREAMTAYEASPEH